MDTASSAPHAWRDWLWSLLMHAVVLGVSVWWLHRAPMPAYTPVDTPIAWANSAGGGGGGGGGEGTPGGGGGSGDGSELLKADGVLPKSVAKPAQEKTVPQQAIAAPKKPDLKTPELKQPAHQKTLTESSKHEDTKTQAAIEDLVAAKKRELAARLAAELGRTEKTGLDAAKTGGIGDGQGSGIGSGKGPGIDSGSGGGVGSGTGTGVGSGKGPGVGRGEGSGVGSGVGAGVGSGFGDGSGKDAPNWRSVLKAYMDSHKRYPYAARLLRREGKVIVQASFSAEGVLLSASVAKSSGVAALDEAALLLVREAAVAAAAKAQPGLALPVFHIPVDYKLVN
jgi:TonB family protein